MSDFPLDDAVDAVADAFVPKFQPGDEAGTKAAKQKRWEHNNVALLLAHYSLRRQAAEIARAVRDGTGLNQLTFAGFKLLNPTFPLWLAFRKIDNLHAGKLVEAYTKPSRPVRRRPGDGRKADEGAAKGWAYRAFEAAEAEAPERYQGGGGYFGLVYELVYAEDGPRRLITNYGGPLRPPAAAGRRHVYDVPWADPPQVEDMRFETFLTRLPWQPG